MPYARRAYRKRPYRKSSTSRGRPPVPKKRKTTRSYVRNNALATRANVRKISRLVSSQFGPTQRNLQLSGNLVVINATQPVAFDAADFTSTRTAPGGQQAVGCTVWQVNNLLTGIVTASNFQVIINNALWTPSNTDFPDGGRYKPLYAEYQIEIQGRNNIDDCWCQMDLFTQHHGFQQYALGQVGTNTQQRIMPNALIHMGNMVDVNQLNPSLFKKYKTKRLYLNSQTSLTETQGATDGTTATTGNTKYFRFRVAPKRVRKQMFTTPDTPGEIDDPTLQTGVGNYGYLQVDPRTPFWCMLSTNDRTSLDGDSVKVRIRRHVVWKDINGGTHL